MASFSVSSLDGLKVKYITPPRALYGKNRATSFIGRLFEITESMVLADAYAGLAFLAERPEIDPKRVALVGFSYGGMSTMYALNAAVADKLLPSGLRFAGHVAFYGPCIARFEIGRAHV